MGHIELAAPVSHIWYFKGIPSRMGLDSWIFLQEHLEKVLYFASYIVLESAGRPELQVKQVLVRAGIPEKLEKITADTFRVGMGAEAIQELLQRYRSGRRVAELERRT